LDLDPKPGPVSENGSISPKDRVRSGLWEKLDEMTLEIETLKSQTDMTYVNSTEHSSW
jgi:hypothetical protein